MKVLIQRVTQASVTVNDEAIGAIETGLVLLVGIEKQDTSDCLGKMAKKVSAYRLFSDPDGKMNLNVNEVNGGVLAVSQFTLAADTKKGLRPGFSVAAPPDLAAQLFDEFIRKLKEYVPNVATGRFGADMKVRLINDGPVTFMLEM